MSNPIDYFYPDLSDPSKENSKKTSVDGFISLSEAALNAKKMKMSVYSKTLNHAWVRSLAVVATAFA